LSTRRGIERRSTPGQVLGEDPGAQRPAKTRAPVPMLLRLQQAAGNQAVSRLVAQRSAAPAGPVEDDAGADLLDDSFSVAIPAAAPDHDPDAVEGAEQAGEVDGEGVTAAIASGLPEAPEPADGGEVALPDMATPDVNDAETDPVSASVSFSATVTNTGAVNPFGATSWATFNVTNIKVKKTKAKYIASFKVKNPITYNVTSGGRTHIASSRDGALTAANYATAASDLTPNMADLGGRPPRTLFWARDLTLRHERFHSRERRRLNGQGAKQAKTWLAGQTANSAADVQALIAQVPGRIIASSQAAVGTLQQKESRAYGDGVPRYKARAKAITKRGTAGRYP